MKRYYSLHNVLATLTIIVSFLAAANISYSKTADDQTWQRQFALENGTAIQGYDPVSYHQASGPLEGSPEISEIYKGIRYYFATEANRKAFKKNPEAYEPLFGGWCAWAMLDGEKVEINPNTFKLINGKLALFYDTFWADTLKKWERKIAEGHQEKDLFKKASEEWAKILNQNL